MKEIETSKLYLGFPVYIISLEDKNKNIHIATMSSSYTLGNVLVLGMSKLGNTAQNITINQTIAVNYLSSEQGLLSDIAGWTSGETDKGKYNQLNVNFEYMNGVPYIDKTLATLFGTVNNIIEDENYYHVFLTIEKRLIDKNIINSNGKLIYKKMNPLLYLGDDKRRVYKNTNEKTTFSGGFLKDSKKQK